MNSTASSTGHRFEFIEIGRGVAALLVVCFHATGIVGLPKYFGQTPLGGAFNFGYAGVDFFFVLSGFIIFYSTAKNHANPAAALNYLKHRLIRIYPIYGLVALLLLPMAYLMGHQVGATNALLDFLLLPRDGGPFVIVAWTLRHEMLFYLSFLLFFVHVRLAWGYFMAWGCVIVVYAFLHPDNPAPFVSLYFNDHNLEFLLGILIAHFAKLNRLPRIRPTFVFYVGAAVFLSAGFNESIIHAGKAPVHHYHLLYGVGAGLMIAGLIRLKADLKNLWVRAGAFFGRASYSIYLIHFAVLSAVIKPLSPLGLALWLNWILLILAGVMVGSLLYRYVEKPLLASLRNRYLKDAS
jgi:peptidoglycan/LPS O-acetylase OafA/YrhL